MKIGFIGQGFVGKAYADYYEKRGYEVVRYSLEEPYVQNKGLLQGCDVVSISVPTPMTREGFDTTVVRAVLPLVGKGKIALVRSTMLPGTTEELQSEFPDLFVMHVPEFLTARLAAEESTHPRKNIVGIPKDTPEFRQKAQEILNIMPNAAHKSIVSSRDAEMIKYIQNNFLYVKNVYMGICYKFAESMGCDLDNLYSAFLSEPMMGGYHHLEPVRHGGYGAGGMCLLKDFESFIDFYEKNNPEESGLAALKAIRDRNIEMLKKSNKDTAIIESIYGKAV